MSESENVLLFYPNLIGYGRIVTALGAMWLFPTSPVAAMTLYVISALFDAVDGHVARAFNQSTRFGAMLDMLTDRCATLGLVMYLCVVYPQWAFLFQLSAIIDVASHWLYMVASYFCGQGSHKAVSIDNAVMRLYYSSKPFLFVMCAGNELFYCSLYLGSFFSTPPVGSLGALQLVALVCGPVAVVKSLIGLVHLASGAQMLAELDVKERRAKSQTKAH